MIRELTEFKNVEVSSRKTQSNGQKVERKWSNMTEVILRYDVFSVIINIQVRARKPSPRTRGRNSCMDTVAALHGPSRVQQAE